MVMDPVKCAVHVSIHTPLLQNYCIHMPEVTPHTDLFVKKCQILGISMGSALDTKNREKYLGCWENTFTNDIRIMGI